MTTAPACSARTRRAGPIAPQSAPVQRGCKTGRQPEGPGRPSRRPRHHVAAGGHAGRHGEIHENHGADAQHRLQVAQRARTDAEPQPGVDDRAHGGHDRQQRHGRQQRQRQRAPAIAGLDGGNREKGPQHQQPAADERPLGDAHRQQRGERHRQRGKPLHVPIRTRELAGTEREEQDDKHQERDQHRHPLQHGGGQHAALRGGQGRAQHLRFRCRFPGLPGNDLDLHESQRLLQVGHRLHGQVGGAEQHRQTDEAGQQPPELGLAGRGRALLAGHLLPAQHLHAHQGLVEQPAQPQSDQQPRGLRRANRRGGAHAALPARRCQHRRHRHRPAASPSGTPPPMSLPARPDAATPPARPPPPARPCG